MENKKPLVIIPPYSEPLKKLGAILASPEESAQTEIYVVDDLKEAGQLIPTLGQCLIVIANAKKCALFLQENRWAISKNHSKVILMTPKEIPQKTLMKFLKIGLTEVILETLPPKSLLYKIKLLLRSVKGQKNEKEENINVKSMLDMSQVKSSDEQQRVEKGIIADSGTSEFTEEKERKMELEVGEESLDYLKAKKKTTEENVIDTHWKTMKKADDIQMDMEEEELTKTKNENEEISTYYKSDRDTNIELDLIDDPNMRGKASGRDEVSDFSIEKLKRQALDELNIDDADKKQKPKTSNFESEDDEEEFVDKKILEELDLTNDKYVDKKEESFTEEKKKEKKLGIEEAAAPEKKKREADNDLNHIDGYLKGKINQNALDLTAEEDEFVDKKESHSEFDDESDEIEKAIELESTIPDYVEKKKSNLEETEEKQNKNKNAIEQIENADAYMRGKLQTQQMQLEDEDFFDKKAKLEETRDINKSKLAEASLQDEDQAAKRKDLTRSLDIDDDNAAPDFIDTDDTFTHDDIQRKEKSQQTELELDHSNNDDLTNLDNEENESRHQKLQRLTIDENEEDGLDIEKTAKDESSNPRLKKLNSTQFELENGLDHAVGNGQVEHLDKYMRSRESKSQEQDWNLGTKKKDVDLQVEKSRSAQVDLNLKNDFKDAGEITIDYRKLKEEFELLKEGASLPPEELEKLRKTIRGEIDEDESSIRVYLPEPKNVDFAIEVSMDLMDNNMKPKDIWEKIARKIQTQKGYAVFFQYSKPSDLKEAFSIFQLMDSSLIREDFREKFTEMKKDSDYFKTQAKYSLANWRCAEILNADNKSWEDTELPLWAEQELQNKAVEYIYPMYDGLDRMGHIYIWFPEGIVYHEAKFIDLLLETSRALYLEQIIRSSAAKNTKNNDEETTPEKEKSNFLSGITSLFGKKKVG